MRPSGRTESRREVRSKALVLVSLFLLSQITPSLVTRANVCSLVTAPEVRNPRVSGC